jgi:hypothetical protein
LNKLYIAVFTLLFNVIQGQTEWTGPMITFTKTNNADWTLEQNQDRITDKVWITRGENRGIFNIAVESVGGQSGTGPQPSDTEWAFGSISDGVQNLSFSTWGATHSSTTAGNPPSLIGRNMVVHLITDDIYIDIRFLSWSTSGSGGGFSYERSSNQTLSTSGLRSKALINLSPNPAGDVLSVSGLKGREPFYIYSILGASLMSGTLSPEGFIFIDNLKAGVYFIQIGRDPVMKFIKE